MAPLVTVLAGPPLSGKTELLLGQYRTKLEANTPGSVLWLAPTWRAAAAVRDRLLGANLAGCFRPGIMTFSKFAAAVLEASPDPIRPLSGPMKRQLVRQLLDEQNARSRLKHFQPIVHTSGLVDLVVEFLSELKRLEIWPEHFRQACDARGISAKDEELLEIYESYQQALREHQLFDTEGSFWSARNWLNQGQRRPFENLQFAVADGFSDFTRTQHEILEILAGRVESLSISLTLEPPPYREDLFAKPLKTLAELRARHPGLSVQSLERRSAASGLAAMQHIERHLFGNPRQAQAAETTAGIEILAAARPIGEMEMIGARVKRLIVEEGVKPGDIAVVFRSPQDSGSLAAEVFSRLGLPIAWEQGERLDRVPILRSLVRLLKLDMDDWPFNSLLAVIGGNYFQPVWPEWQTGRTSIDLERAIRQQQIPQGRKALLKELSSLPLPSPLSLLAAAFDELPAKATLPGWAKAWEKLARQTGMLRDLDWKGESGKPGIQKSDALAWKCLLSLLSAGDRLAGWLKQHPPELTREEAFRALVDILGSERLPAGAEESGRVRVLSASSVRSLHIPYLFLAGLSEKAFPQPDREDRLYSEAEYLRLIEQNLPLVTRTERNREEMLLFYEAITRATKRLYLSYPALDDSAQPLSPSPFLLEVEQACGMDKIAKTEATDFRPVPKTAQPLSPAEFRIAAIAEALEGNYRWLAGLRDVASGAMPTLAVGLKESPTTPPHAHDKRGHGNGGSIFPAAQNLFAGLELTLLRQDRERFGAAEGVLLGEPVRKLLRAEFPPSRTFSVTELESYARCPFRFLMERILKLEPLEDIALETDYLERGQTVHEVLAAFHQKVNQSHGKPTSPAKIDEAEFSQSMQAAIEEGLPPSSGNPVRAALREIDRRLVVKWLADYRRQHETYDSQWFDCETPPAPRVFRDFLRPRETSEQDLGYRGHLGYSRRQGEHPAFRPHRPGRYRIRRRPRDFQRPRLQDRLFGEIFGR